MFGKSKKTLMPTPEQALPGRREPMPVPERHHVNGNRIVPPFPEGSELALFGLGCFWGAEKAFWKIPEAGHTGGFDARPREYALRLTAFFDAALLAPARIR